MMRVRDYMTQVPLYTVSDQANLKEAVLLLQRHSIRHLPVTNGTKLVGMMTDRDMRRASPSHLLGIGREEFEQTLLTTPVSRIMTRNVITVTPDTLVVDAVRLMSERKFGGIPVVVGDDLVGMFTEVDAFKILLEEKKYRKIMVTVDGSSFANKALSHAEKMAVAFCMVIECGQGTYVPMFIGVEPGC